MKMNLYSIPIVSSNSIPIAFSNEDINEDINVSPNDNPTIVMPAKAGMTMVVTMAVFLFFLAPAYALTQDTHSFSSPEEAQRFYTLTQTIRCVVCQNQNIADSNAPLANDLREKVYRMVLEKKSDPEIKNYLAARYGEFILLEPRFSKTTFILWIFPFITLLLIFALFFRRLSRRVT